MNYLILAVNDIELAERYSQAFWALCIGSYNGGITRRLSGILTHPSGKAVAIELPDQEWSLAHDADGSMVSKLLGEFATANEKGALTRQLNQAAKDKLKVRAIDMIPAKFAALVRTHQQMEAEGWFKASSL